MRAIKQKSVEALAKHNLKKKLLRRVQIKFCRQIWVKSGYFLRLSHSMCYSVWKWSNGKLRIINFEVIKIKILVTFI